MLGLFGGELERRGHEGLAGTGLVLAGPDGGDDLVDEIEGLEETLDDMGPASGLIEAVLGPTGDDLDLVVDVGDQRITQVERARDAVDECHGVDREVGLQRCALVEVVEDDECGRVALETQHQAHLALGRLVVQLGDAVELAVVDEFLHLDDELVRAHLVRQFGDHDEVAPGALLDLGLAAQLDGATAGPIGVHDPLAAHDERPGGEIGTLDELHEVVRCGLGVGEQMVHRVDDLGEVVRRDVRGHADGDALGTVHQQVGETAGENHRLLELTRVVVDEVDGVLVDVGEHVERHRSETTFGVAGGGRRLVERSEVALRVDERMTQAERLPHADECVVDRGVAMGVVLAHDLTGDTGAFHRGPVRERAQVVHAPEDAAVHRLEAVAGVGECTRHDDRHGVVEEGAFHLLLDLDGLDGADGRCCGDGTVVGRRVVGGGVVAHDVSSSPNGGVLRCRGSARPWRWSG